MPGQREWSFAVLSALFGGNGVERCPVLLYIFAAALGARDLQLLVFGNRHEFGENPLATVAEKLILGHKYLHTSGLASLFMDQEPTALELSPSSRLTCELHR
jgi:hypothetical protein